MHVYDQVNSSPVLYENTTRVQTRNTQSHNNTERTTHQSTTHKRATPRGVPPTPHRSRSQSTPTHNSSRAVHDKHPKHPKQHNRTSTRTLRAPCRQLNRHEKSAVKSRPQRPASSIQRPAPSKNQEDDSRMRQGFTLLTLILRRASFARCLAQHRQRLGEVIAPFRLVAHTFGQTSCLREYGRSHGADAGKLPR